MAGHYGIAAPMVGGLVTSFIVELLVYPAIYYLWRRKGLAEGAATISAPGEGAAAVDGSA